MTDAGPNGHTLSDAAVKAQDAAVAAFMAEAEKRDPKRVARVSKRLQVLTPNQLRYRESREQELSDLMGRSLALAIDGRGKRLHPPTDV